MVDRATQKFYSNLTSSSKEEKLKRDNEIMADLFKRIGKPTASNLRKKPKLSSSSDKLLNEEVKISKYTYNISIILLMFSGNLSSLQS